MGYTEKGNGGGLDVLLVGQQLSLGQIGTDRMAVR